MVPFVLERLDQVVVDLSDSATLQATAAALGLVHLSPSAEAAGGKTLETVKARGNLLCTGHDGSYLGFAEVDDKGNWKGMDIDLFVDTLGNVPGDLMNWCYLTLKPFRLNHQKYVGLVDILDDKAELENFLRMEKWIFDSPNQAGQAFREFIRDFYQGNKLMEGGLAIGDKPVDLKKVTMPVLNIYAEQDHLVPPSASIPLKEKVGTKDYTVLAFKGGHIGIYVSGRAQREVAPTIHSWLSKRV